MLEWPATEIPSAKIGGAYRHAKIILPLFGRIRCL